jgi:hypothetical protein
MNMFRRHVSTRLVDYAWAYRLRLSNLRAAIDPTDLLAGSKAPVLLLPGVYESWHFLRAVGTRMHEEGHPVHIVPTFNRNMKPVPIMAGMAADYVIENDLSGVWIVGHSKGGLIGKTLLLSRRVGERFSGLVAVNSPFSGSDYAHLVPMRALREFVPTNPTVTRLDRESEINGRITSIYSEWDPIVPNGSELRGANNIRLPISGHFRILDTPSLLDEVSRAIHGG